MENNNQERKRDRVRKMFNDIAPTYDRLNHILSMSIDRLWRKRVVKVVRRLGAKHILDMATGTGDLAIALARTIKGSSICGADLSPEMLEVARRKVEQLGLDERITLTECDAEHIDMADEQVDAVTVAFGVRNFENIEACLAELRRVIKPEGHIVILEFSNPSNRLIGWLYRFYFHRVLPTIGGIISRNRGAYEYLPASVDTFPTPSQFAKILEECGFENVKTRSQSAGIAQIYIAKRK